MSTGKTEITQCDRRLGSSQFRGGTDTRSGGNEATQRKPMCSAAISAVWEAGLCPGRGRYGNCRTGYTATGGRGLDHSVVGAGSEVRVVLGSACPAASWTSRRLARASRLSVFLQPNRAGGVLTKERAFADVAAKHRGALGPVCSAMTRSGTPAAAAEVARPARSECPATSPGQARFGRRGASTRAPLPGR